MESKLDLYRRRYKRYKRLAKLRGGESLVAPGESAWCHICRRNIGRWSIKEHMLHHTAPKRTTATRGPTVIDELFNLINHSFEPKEKRERSPMLVDYNKAMKRLKPILRQNLSTEIRESPASYKPEIVSTLIVVLAIQIRDSPRPPEPITDEDKLQDLPYLLKTYVEAYGNKPGEYAKHIGNYKVLDTEFINALVDNGFSEK